MEMKNVEKIEIVLAAGLCQAVKKSKMTSFGVIILGG